MIELLLVIYGFGWLPWWVSPAVVWLVVAVVVGFAVWRVIRLEGTHCPDCSDLEEEARDGR